MKRLVVASLVVLMVAGLPARGLAADPATPAGGRSQHHHRVLIGAVTGAIAGAAAGWFLWARSHDCGRCEPGPGKFVSGGAILGGVLGAAIAAGMSGTGHPAIGGPAVRISRRVTFIPSLSSTRREATLQVRF
jgi:hypothetical protein